MRVSKWGFGEGTDVDVRMIGCAGMRRWRLLQKTPFRIHAMRNGDSHTATR